MWLGFRNVIFTKLFIFFFREEIIKKKKMKHVKESTMSDEIANKDIENTAKNVKSSEEATEVVKEIEKNY